MTKTELSKIVADRLGITAQVASDVISMAFDEIVETALSGDPYQHFGFGKFLISTRGARKIHDVNTKETRIIPEKKILRLSTSRRLNRRLSDLDS